MLEAMIAGITDSQALAALALGRLKQKQDALEHALAGLIGPHQRLLLRGAAARTLISLMLKSCS